MPTYEYACPACGGFESLRPLAQRNTLCACPACGAESARVFASAPRLACMSSSQRMAHETNERASHAPLPSSRGAYGRLRHPAGCGCCTGGAARAVAGAKAFPRKRPWMISH